MVANHATITRDRKLRQILITGLPWRLCGLFGLRLSPINQVFQYSMGVRVIAAQPDTDHAAQNEKENGGSETISKPPSSLQSRMAFAQVLFDILNRLYNVHFCNRAQRNCCCKQTGRNRNNCRFDNRHNWNGHKL